MARLLSRVRPIIDKLCRIRGANSPARPRGFDPEKDYE
jgi:hypothetical protein